MLFHIFHIIDHICFRVIDADGNDFPVEFTIINHGKHTDRFHFVDTAHLSCGASNFDNVDWIIVSCHTVSIHFCVGDVWIFPCLWYQSIVPIDVVGIEPEVPFLDVLLYGCGRFIRGDFHFGRCFFRNLTDEIQGPILIIQGDVMPRRDVLSLFVLKEHAEAGAVGFPPFFRVVCCTQDAPFPVMERSHSVSMLPTLHHGTCRSTCLSVPGGSCSCQGPRGRVHGTHDGFRGHFEWMVRVDGAVNAHTHTHGCVFGWSRKDDEKNPIHSEWVC
mmetsp:Transcript_5625/g.34899  ORF Transcript_5625/g.34899 Transcript_5625/m.34899 type:complete len:273 (-) Transcript_5625:68-886(-)